jgi:hypothetical protein
MDLLTLLEIIKSEDLFDLTAVVVENSEVLSFHDYFGLFEVRKSNNPKIVTKDSKLLKGLAVYRDFQNPEIVPDAIFYTIDGDKINYFVVE